MMHLGFSRRTSQIGGTIPLAQGSPLQGEGKNKENKNAHVDACWRIEERVSGFGASQVATGAGFKRDGTSNYIVKRIL